MITKEQIRNNHALEDAAIEFVCRLYDYAQGGNLTGYIDNIIADYSFLFWESNAEKEMAEDSHSALQVLRGCATGLDAAFRAK